MVIDGAFLPQIAQINTDKTHSTYRPSVIIGVSSLANAMTYRMQGFEFLALQKTVS